MAAYDIKQHFKGLRAESGHRKGRRDPFATGFSDDESEQDRRSRRRERSSSIKNTKTSAPPIQRPQELGPTKTSVLDQLWDSDDEELLNASTSRSDRRPSPAPGHSKNRGVSDTTAERGNSVDKSSQTRKNGRRRSSIVQAAGPLAYLDESDDDKRNPSPRRTDRGPSPAPRKGSDSVDPLDRSGRSGTPRGSRGPIAETSQTRKQPSRHTVASPFAGTKYLEDSDSDTDEEAVSSRQGSTDTAATSEPPESLSPYDSALSPKHPEVKRVDKPKQQQGGGVSWRAFSASRHEQRNSEIQALQTSLRQRGKSISFGSFAKTDDGKQIPIPADVQGLIGSGLRRGRGRPGPRGKSPPRRASDTEPTPDEVDDTDRDRGGLFDGKEFKSNSFTAVPATPAKEMETQKLPNITTTPTRAASRPSTFMASPTGDVMSDSPATSPRASSDMISSSESILSKLMVSPQTIPEGVPVEHSIMSPTSGEITSPLSRDSSLKSSRPPSRPTRVPRRQSRRTNSGNTSVSPAHAFLSSWSKDAEVEPAPEPQPDDEGQAIGLQNEYIIGRTVNQGGFGVVKEVHSITERGERSIRAVKIVRKAIPDKAADENEKAQQELEHEVSVWRHLIHPHILRLHAVYDTDFATFCVMDFNVGGTLFDLVRKSRASASADNSGSGGRKGLEPRLAKIYAYQLASALRYLHEDIRVCHRDIKLENCLVDMTGVADPDTDPGILRLCDFGLADFLHSDSSLDDSLALTEDHRLHFSPASSSAAESNHPTTSSVIGTLEYASPKGLSVHRKLFETAGDLWAFGVIVYVLCTGDLPFKHPMPSKTIELIIQADWDDGALKNAAAGSDSVIELVQGCLEKDIDLRWTVGEVLRSPWFDGCVDLVDAEGIGSGGGGPSVWG
ncbi:kinase-like protein [Hortaea werneckii]|nr:kinase-like protein [Hortaea werneckii]